MKRFSTTMAFLVLAAGIATVSAQQPAAKAPKKLSPAQTAIQQAAEAGKYAFIFFWKGNDDSTNKARQSVQAAAAKWADKVEMVSFWADDPAEKALAAQYGISRVPLPLVMSIAPCGAITKAFTKDFDEKNLHTAFVSPCTARCLKALQDQKLVLLCVVEKVDAKNPPPLPQGVQDFKADKEYASTTEVILLDAGDAAEAGFLKDLEVGPHAAKPLTVFLAPPGVVVGRFGAEAAKDVLVEKLTAAQSSCCPGGKCGSGGCGGEKK
jgi:hypothetical protein